MSKIFTCTIIHDREIELGQILINAEMLLIYAETLAEAFGKLIVHRNYSDISIINFIDDRSLLANVKKDDIDLYVLIGEPSEILPRVE